MAKMWAVQLTERRKPMEFREIPIPVIGDEDVLVRITASGVCPDDRQIWNGDWTPDRLELPLPITLGHEIGGVIERVGADVVDLRPGMRVCVPFNFADGDCPYCRKGLQNLCDNASWNFSTPGSGGFAQFARVPNARLNCIPLPENVTDIDGAALGCRYMTAYRAVRSRAKVQAGETVAIVGLGGLGRSAVQIASAVGGQVIAIDRDPNALEAASMLGATHVLNSQGLNSEDVAEAIKKMTGARGVDVSIDAVGGSNATLTALAGLAKGGRLCVAGLTSPDDEGRVSIPIDRVVLSELTVVGTLGNPHGDYPELLELVDAGTLQPSRLVGEEIALRDVPSVIERPSALSAAGFTMITDFDSLIGDHRRHERR